MGISGAVPLVLFHSDPRSGSEFKYLMSAMSTPWPFIAVDYYGMGFSEECQCEESKFVGFTDYASSVNEILLKHKINKFIPVGCLKGTNPALALANLAGPGRVEKVIQISPLMLPPSAIDYMLNKFIPSIMNPSIKSDGSHLLEVWKDPSAAPFGPDSKPGGGALDLLANEEKTIDFLRCRNNGARVKNQQAWVHFNDKIPVAMRSVTQHAHFLFIYATHIDADHAKYGMHPEWSKTQLTAALEGGLSYGNVTIEDATQGLLEQNSTYVASLIESFLLLQHLQVEIV